MNPMLSDEDLTALLGEAAAGFDVPVEGPGFVLQEYGDRPVRSHRKLLLVGAAAALVALALVVNGGGSGIANRTTSAGSAYDSAAGVKAAAPPQPAEGALVPAAGPQTTSAQGGQAAPVDGARVVKTGDLSLVVDDGRVSDTVGRVTALAKGVGGYVADSSTQELGDNPTATITLRVPVASFEDVIAKVRALKVQVVSESASGKDVTAAYADTQAQIQSLQAARQRFLVILGRAKTIGETLAVQQRVDDVQGQIDRLEGQRRVLENQSDKATLTVTVGEKADQALVTQERSGLSKAWYDARHGFTSGVESLLAHSGRALLVLLVLAVGLVLARPTWRLARRRLV